MTEILKISNANVYLDRRLILENINWQVSKGEHWFILGQNGSGKTTLTRLLLGYVWPKFGATLKDLGNTYGRCDIFQVRKNIAWVNPFLQGWTGAKWTVLKVVISGLFGTIGLYEKYSDQQEKKAIEMLEKLNCQHLSSQTFDHISSGEQMKVLIARALIIEPSLIILDEACVHLDIKSREFFLNTIDSVVNGKNHPTIIFVTQRTEDLIPSFKNGLLLKNGKIVASGPQDEILTEENLANVFDTPLKIIKTENHRYLTVLK